MKNLRVSKSAWIVSKRHAGTRVEKKSSNSKSPCNPTARLLNHGITTHNLAGIFFKPGLVSANLAALLPNVGALFFNQHILFLDLNEIFSDM